jgi:hypothetical protein
MDGGATASFQTQIVAATAAAIIDGDLRRELFKKRLQMVDDINDEPKGLLAGEQAQRFWKVDFFSD